MLKFKKIYDRLFEVNIEGKIFLVQTFPFSIYEMKSTYSINEIIKCLPSYNDVSVHKSETLDYYNLELIITTRCNLACDYCHVNETKGYYGLSSADMNEKVWMKAIDDSLEYVKINILKHKLKKFEYELYYLGGEPLLNFKAVKDSYIYAKNKILIIKKQTGVDVNLGAAISTNGTLLNKEIVSFLVFNNIEMSITIDGVNHDSHRIYPNGSGTLDDILAHINLLQEHDFKKLKLFSVIPPQYAKDLSKIVDFYKKKGLFEMAYRISIVPKAVTRMDTDRGCPIPKSSFSDKTITTYTDEKCADFSHQLNLLYSDHNVDDRNLYKKIMELIQGGGVTHRCPAGLWKHSITPDGSVWPCHQLVNIVKFKMGHLEKDALFFEKNGSVRQIFYNRTAFNTNPCADCVLQTICPPLVDCPARGFIEEGDIQKVPTTYCKIYREYLLDRLRDAIKELSTGA